MRDLFSDQESAFVGPPKDDVVVHMNLRSWQISDAGLQPRRVEGREFG